MRLRLLRLFLAFAAVAWGVSVVGIFLSWSAAVGALQGLGAQPIAYDRMLDYWLRMASGAFALIGAWYLVLMLWPQKFAVAIPWFGALMLLEGCILLFHGIRLSLPPFPFYGDTLACFVGGGGILWFSRTPTTGNPRALRSRKLFASRKSEGKAAVWILVAVALLGVLIFNPVGLAFLGAFLGMGQIRLTEAKLRKSQIYEPMARTLATYCQSDLSLFPKYLSYAWLPQGLAPLGDPRCSLTTNYADVEMGGGFYHYGYHLQLNEAASTGATNAWQLSLRREGSQDIRLMTLALSSSNHVVAADLEKLVASGFNASIKRGNTDGYRGKVLVHLRFGNTLDAVQTCQDWIEQQPTSWFPRFTYAHVRCRRGDVNAASAEFEDWVQHHKNFAHCIYLALFEFREGRTNEALKGVRWALEQPFVEPAGTEGNKFYLGQNGSLLAYVRGDYDLSLAMCDKMLSSSDKDKWWTPKVLKIKAAVELMKNDQATALALMQRAATLVDHPSFGSESIEKADNAFRAALERKDLAFVRDFHNCVNELDTWFSPFETDETGIHGSALNIPSPYPKSWTTDKMVPQKDRDSF